MELQIAVKKLRATRRNFLSIVSRNAEVGVCYLRPIPIGKQDVGFFNDKQPYMNRGNRSVVKNIDKFIC